MSSIDDNKSKMWSYNTTHLWSDVHTVQGNFSYVLLLMIMLNTAIKLNITEKYVMAYWWGYKWILY